MLKKLNSKQTAKVRESFRRSRNSESRLQGIKKVKFIKNESAED